MTTSRFRLRAVLLAATALAAPIAFSSVVTSPAYAWRIVFDPSNYAQNVLTAARTLEQITHQITSLQNEATMLINQARNLANLPFSALQTLQQNVQKTQQLLQQAQGIAFNVQQIDQMFSQKYGNVSMSATDQQLVSDARSRWQNTVGGLQDAMRVQAGVVGNIDTNRTQMSELQSQQLSDLVALLAANGRAGALTEAERTAAAEQGREQRRRFLTPGSGYQPGNAQMFNGN
jgi:type IV secretion system protein TrbJ